MYRILKEEGIELPRYAILNRDPDKPDGNLVIHTNTFVASVVNCHYI